MGRICPCRLPAGINGNREAPERFRAKWIPVRVKKTRQNRNLEPRSDSIGTEKALAALAQIAARQRDNWSPSDPARRGFVQFLSHFDGGFRQLLGNSEHILAPFHFAPDIR